MQINNAACKHKEEITMKFYLVQIYISGKEEETINGVQEHRGNRRNKHIVPEGNTIQ